MAQLVEQRIRNAWVGGSSPPIGFSMNPLRVHLFYSYHFAAGHLTAKEIFMKPALLASTLDELIQETKKGHVSWQIELQSTDGLSDSIKQRVTEDDKEWIVDECFISFYCKFRGKDYLMITYEHIRRYGDQVRSDNLIFMPPLSVRYFDVGILSPYIVDANAVLLDKFHQLWLLVLDSYKKKDGHVSMKLFDPYD